MSESTLDLFGNWLVSEGPLAPALNKKNAEVPSRLFSCSVTPVPSIDRG